MLYRLYSSRSSGDEKLGAWEEDFIHTCEVPVTHSGDDTFDQASCMIVRHRVHYDDIVMTEHCN